jgi:erythritol kinase
MADRPLYIGVDAGTSMAKAAAFDEGGKMITVASRPVPLQHPGPGRVEQDPEVIVRSVQTVLAEVCASTGVRRPELVAITGQGDGCWLFDEHAVPVRAGISWMDGRAGGIVRDWETSGICDAIFAENGNMMFPGAPAPILAWLDQHEPEVLARASTAGYLKDLLLQHFTGVRATDSSEASLPFGALNIDPDGPLDDYSAAVLQHTGLSHRAGLLAPVQRPLPTGNLTASGAGTSTLLPGTPIVAGPYDIPACAIGAGRLGPGDGLLIVGTTLACSVLIDRVDLSGPRAGMTITMPDPGRWLRVMAAMVGTASLDWALGMLDVRFEALNDLLEQTPAGSNGVQVLPYLAPSGERAPFVDPAANAQFSGISLTSTRDDLIRGLCEGLAYAARSCFDAAGLTGDVYVCGGGSQSPAWLRIFASVLGRPLFLARTGEVGARGAVLAAAAATGRSLDAELWTGPLETVHPVAADVQLYHDGYERFGELLAAARPLWSH